MATFLKIVSGVYLVIVWFAFWFMVAATPDAFAFLGIRPTLAYLGPPVTLISFLSALILSSIPAVVLFAFGQIVGDIRIIRNNARLQSEHLEALRSYYEHANQPVIT